MALQCCNGFCHKTARISISIIFPSFLSLPPTLFPISPLLFVPDHQAELPVLNSNFPLAICFTYGNVYISVLLSPFVPPSSSPAVSINLFCMNRISIEACQEVFVVRKCDFFFFFFFLHQIVTVITGFKLENSLRNS